MSTTIIHPVLRPSQVKKLSLRNRLRAEAAQRGSYEALVALANGSENIPPHEVPYLAPVFYHALDISSIDIFREAQSRTAEIDAKVDIIVHATRALAVLIEQRIVDDSAIHDCWNRIWPWFEFLANFCQALPIQERTSVYMEIVFTVAAIGGRLRMEDDARDCVARTPGLFRVIGAAWRHLLHAQVNEVLGEISNCLCVMFYRARDNARIVSRLLDELAEGCGQSWRALAALLIKHLALVVPSPDPASDGWQPMVEGPLRLVDAAISNGNRDFYRALLKRGIVQRLVVIVRASASLDCNSHNHDHDHAAGGDCTGHHNTMVRDSAFVALARYLRVPRCQDRLADALGAGILQAFVAYRADLVRPGMNTPKGSLYDLMRRLGRYSLYYTVLSPLRASLKELPSQMSERVGVDVGKVWVSVVELFEHRSPILDQYESGELTKLRACDRIA